MRKEIFVTRHEELVARGRAIVQGAPQLYIDLDVEGDGPPGIGSLLSIGAVSPFENDKSFYVELQPTNKPGIPHSRQFCEENGLERERLMVEGVEPIVAMRRLKQWVAGLIRIHGKTQPVLVAFPSWFDFGHINVGMFESRLANPFNLDGHCIQSLALGLGADYDWNCVSRAKLPPEVIPPLPFTHHALEDALFQQRMHFAMVGLINERRPA